MAIWNVDACTYDTTNSLKSKFCMQRILVVTPYGQEDKHGPEGKWRQPTAEFMISITYGRLKTRVQLRALRPTYKYGSNCQ